MAEPLIPTKLRIVLEIRRVGEDAYGYRLKKVLRLSTATMFEHLAELQRSGLVVATERTVAGRTRKVYKLTKRAEGILDDLAEHLAMGIANSRSA